MAIKVLDNNRKILTNASHLYIAPYKAGSETELNELDPTAPKTRTYDMISIVADSMSLTQDDNENQTTDWEFGDTPLYETIKLGKFQFTADCIDVQNEIMKELMGWSTETGFGGNSASAAGAPIAYTDLYVAIAITFHDDNSPIIVMPKVKLNAKFVMESLKTGTAKATLSGTCYTGTVANMSDPDDPQYKSLATPVAFVPRGAGNDEALYVNGSISSTAAKLAHFVPTTSSALN